MPTNVDKALYVAPGGQRPGDEPTIEVEIELPGAKVEEEVAAPAPGFYDNLIEDEEALEDSTITYTASTLLSDIKDDIRARADWEKTYSDGINLLGLKYEMRTEPWQGACGVFHPMITEAVIRFQADTMLETFPAAGPVKSQIVGKVTKDKEDAAKRVEEDLNWQVTENMVEFRAEHERLLWNLPSAGAGFKKVYKCPILGRQTSVFVPAEDVIIPYGTTDLFTADRVAHRMKKTKVEVEKLMESGFWRLVDLPQPGPETPNDVQQKKDKETGVKALADTRLTFYEVSVDLRLQIDKELWKDADAEVGLPYVITICDNNGKVVALKRNWKESDPQRLRRMHFVQYTYIPGYGAYGFGLFHLLGGFATSATSITRQLVDAGTLSNLPGGLKTKGLRIKGEDQPVSPGEFRDVDVASGSIKDNILPLPYKEPSTALYNLLLHMTEEARRFAATNDIKVADLSSQAPVGTTLAVLERQLRTMTAVQARVHHAFKQELRLIADIIKEDTKEGYDYDVDAPQGARARRADYSYVSIIPVSDPNAATMSQRVVMYQAAIQLAQMAPQIYDQTELHRQMLTILGIKNVGKLVPTEDDIKPVDPVQENQNILNGKPVKAFAWQDHEAHIRVHTAAMQDPLIMQLLGQNPQAQKLLGAAAAHVAEHLGFAYRNRMQLAAGIPLPVLGKDDALPQDVEVQLSRAMAMAAPMVLQQSQQIVAQQQARKNAEDPVLVAQRMQVENERMEIQRKASRDQADVAINVEKLKIEAQEKGVDPTTIQIDNEIKESKALNDMLLGRQQAQHDMALKETETKARIARDDARAQADARRSERDTRSQDMKDSVDLAARQSEIQRRNEAHKQQMAVKAKEAAARIFAQKAAAKKKPNAERKPS